MVTELLITYRWVLLLGIFGAGIQCCPVWAQSQQTKPASGAQGYADWSPHFRPMPNEPYTVATPAPNAALEAVLQKDAEGHEFWITRSKLETVSIGSASIRQVLSDPRGDRVYIITEKGRDILVFDPVARKVVRNIVVPRYPIDMWCDSQRLVVACDESRVVITIDTNTYEILRSIRPISDDAMQPEQLMCPLPDGSMLTKWKRVQPPRTSSLYLLLADGNSKFVTKDADLRFAMALPSKLLWQPDAGGVPYCKRVDGKDVSSLISPAFLKIKPHTQFQTIGLEFLSADQQHVVVPFQDPILLAQLSATKATKESLESAEGSGTLVASSDLKERVHYLPGHIYAEYSKEDAYVGVGIQGTEPSFNLIYFNRSTGRIVRKISVPTGQAFHLITHRSRPTLTFVPGHELTISVSSVAGEMHLIRTGPLVLKAESNSDGNP